MKAVDTALAKHSWKFYLLWPNLAVVVVFLVLLATDQFSNSRELVQAFVRSLIYSNLTSLFGMLVVLQLAERLALRRLPVIFALCLLVAIPLAILIVQTLLMAVDTGVRQHFWMYYLRTLRICLPLAALFGMGAMFHASLRNRVQNTEEKFRQKEIDEERARKMAVEARLRSLESRLQPHFLFNTLNTISSLIAVDPSLAEQIVGRLATLLRASLDKSTQPLIPLREELTMVESYLEIERVRFGEKLRGVVQVPDEVLDAKVPPMSVLGLVENAVKHGISAQIGGGEVAVIASARNGNLYLEVSDTGPGFDLAAMKPGHGLDNLLEQLDATMGGKARLNVVRRESRCVVEMVLPCL